MHPVLFKIGSFEVPSFGVMMVLAFLTGMGIATWRAERYGITKPQVQDVAFWALIAGIFGARAVFILQELPHYLQNPRELMTLRFQGLTSFGGLIFGAIAVIYWAKRNRVNPVAMADVGALAFLAGHTVGRFGCLLNGCCFGGACPANLPWGIHVAGSDVLHHPAQVYDAGMNLAALLFLIWLERRRVLHLGQATGLMLILHGLTRFIYEFWRAGTEAQVARGEASSTYWGSLPFTQAQAMAAVLSAIGIGVYLYYGRRREAVGTPVTA